MKLRIRLVLVLVVLSLTTCAKKETGAEGGPCYGNGTCDAGLVCLSSLCVRPGDGGHDQLAPDTGTPGTVATLAGGVKGFADGPSASARFNLPADVAVDTKGRVYVADSKNHSIRVIAAGKVTTLAGKGTPGFKDGPVASALFNEPLGIAVDAKGQVYVSDDKNHRIRLIANNMVSTFAGSGAAGYADGAVASAKFFKPRGLHVGKGSEVYVVDSDNNRIRRISGGMVSTIAGSGATGSTDGPAAKARFHYPKDIDADAAGKLYVADSYPHKVRIISGGQVGTYAGTGTPGHTNGQAAMGTFKYPYGVAIDTAGRIYVADHQNLAIRVISGGQLSTVAGSGTLGYKDGPAMQAQFRHPVGIDVDGAGKVYVADPWNHAIRVITP